MPLKRPILPQCTLVSIKIFNKKEGLGLQSKRNRTIYFLTLWPKPKDMGILKLKEKTAKTLAILGSILFIAAIVLFFMPVEIPHKTALPVLTAATFSIWLCPWQMTLAFTFSAVGDYFGYSGEFLYQMGAFAVAHIMFIAYFIERYFKKVEHDRKLTGRAKGHLAIVIFCTAALLATAFIKVVPGAEPGLIRTGISIYTCLISLMMLSALLQRSSLYALGAVLFVFSDFIIAWCMFVGPVPHSRLMIMIPYYAAQWILFIRSTPLRIAPEMRILRF